VLKGGRLGGGGGGGGGGSSVQPGKRSCSAESKNSKENQPQKVLKNRGLDPSLEPKEQRKGESLQTKEPHSKWRARNA